MRTLVTTLAGLWSAAALAAPGTMQGVQIGPGGTLSVQEIPVPKPGAGEVLIKVRAAGVNPVDWKIAGNRVGQVAGTDVAGEKSVICHVKIDASLHADEPTPHDDRCICLQIAGKRCRAGVDVELMHLGMIDGDVIGDDDIIGRAGDTAAAPNRRVGPKSIANTGDRGQRGGLRRERFLLARRRRGDAR